MIPGLYTPHIALQPFIENYIISKMDSLYLDLIPRGNNQIFFLLNEKHTATDLSTGLVYDARFFISSPGTRYYRLECSEVLSCVGILFKPYGLYRLLGIPQQLLTDDFTDILQVMPPSFKEVIHQLEDEAEQPLRIVQILEAWLLKQYISFEKIDTTRMAFACNVIDSANGLLGINELASKLYLSKRTLELSFQQQIGLSPKMYSRITRFKQAEKLLNGRQVRDMQSICFDLNYFDQAHFIKEFKHFSGYSPSKYHLRLPDLADSF